MRVDPWSASWSARVPPDPLLAMEIALHRDWV
jgi:hypothetical protein